MANMMRPTMISTVMKAYSEVFVGRGRSPTSVSVNVLQYKEHKYLCGAKQKGEVKKVMMAIYAEKNMRELSKSFFFLFVMVS